MVTLSSDSQRSRKAVNFRERVDSMHPIWVKGLSKALLSHIGEWGCVKGVSRVC